MNYHIATNCLGLFCDIIGALLVFKFGLPEQINKEGHIYLCVEQEDEKQKSMAKRYDLLGKIGGWSLIMGFVLQFISNFL